MKTPTQHLIGLPVVEPDISRLSSELFELDDRVTEKTRWWVLHTKPRAEKMVARLLAADKISFYLPLYKKQQRVQRRNVISHLPLFPGYLFLRGGDEERTMAFETNRIANCLRVEDQSRIDRDLFQLHRSLESGLPVTPEDRIQPGTPAEIVCGPLAGHQGVILRAAGNKLKLVIEINFLQRGAAIEVDSSMIRPTDI